ncbi:hypothetical protein Pmani_005765 [Petrolisthes manimaculis]|uniref:Uncharacterized protein n=1 Tax=Petrolisthes manimaculis TaxID=1843537 RepID=A0AAE1QC13_9EUCA|nr:hypothetical protein Pmani_005765 [Petrolisthes manimaculis]
MQSASTCPCQEGLRAEVMNVFSFHFPDGQPKLLTTVHKSWQRAKSPPSPQRYKSQSKKKCRAFYNAIQYDNTEVYDAVVLTNGLLMTTFRGPPSLSLTGSVPLLVLSLRESAKSFGLSLNALVEQLMRGLRFRDITQVEVGLQGAALLNSPLSGNSFLHFDSIRLHFALAASQSLKARV